MSDWPAACRTGQSNWDWRGGSSVFLERAGADSTLHGKTPGLSGRDPLNPNIALAGLNEIVGRLHPKQGVSVNPEGFFKSDRHFC